MYALFYSQINLVFKFNLVLIRSFLPPFIYLFTLCYSVYLGVHPEPPRFLIRTSKILINLSNQVALLHDQKVKTEI